AEGVHGCIFNEVNGEYKVDIQATEEKRKQIRKERLKQSVPTKELMKQEKQDITNKNASNQDQLMNAESFALNEKITNEFKEFWDIEDDLMVYEDDLNVTQRRHHINRFKN